MNALEHPLLQLTAGDLMNREIRTLPADMPIKEAAMELARWGLRGMPVVDSTGQLIGMLSMSDLARWVAQRHEPASGQPRACAFQQVERYPGGREHVRCLLPMGSCPFQRPYHLPDGQQILLCADPHSVPTDWQIVDTPAAAPIVRDLMTTVVHSIGAHTPLPQLARRMLEEGVHRLLVVNEQGTLLGIVTADDLLQVLAKLDDRHFAPPND
jgi:CBS domain-containing protein